MRALKHIDLAALWSAFASFGAPRANTFLRMTVLTAACPSVNPTAAGGPAIPFRVALTSVGVRWRCHGRGARLEPVTSCAQGRSKNTITLILKLSTVARF